MRRFLTTALAAVTFAGAVAATTAPAQARDYRDYRRYDRHRGNDAGVAVAAGIAGLALGAALSSSGRARGYSDYDRGYYRDRYYGGGYYGGGYYGRSYYAPRAYAYAPPRYRTCEVRERSYDPYYDRSVMVTRRYPC